MKQYEVVYMGETHTVVFTKEGKNNYCMIEGEIVYDFDLDSIDLIKPKKESTKKIWFPLWVAKLIRKI